MTTRPNPVAVADGRVLRVLENVMRTAPLGVRFSDAVLDQPVRHGLLVRARRLHATAWTTARVSSTGLHGFARLPTTGGAETGPVTEFGPTETYVIEVNDRLGRFLPMRFTAPAPAVPDDDPMLLFSRPDRPVPVGFAAVRASLRYEDTIVPAASGRRQRPARHAMATVTVDGLAHDGITDGEGELLVLVPLAEVAAGRPLSEQTVEGALEVRFDPELAPDAAPVPLIDDIVSQPVRGHIEGPPFRPDHSFAIGFRDDVVLTSPTRRELLLAPV